MHLFTSDLYVSDFLLAHLQGQSSARALSAYTGDLNHCRNCTPAPEEGLKESPKHAGQK
jgi:hypothetical protein